MTVEIVIIPGVGGHPAFHDSVIQSLSEHYTVHSAQHGDFGSTPYRCLADHTHYWRGFIESIKATKIVIGISFGSHILVDFLDRPPAGVVLFILVSYWRLGLMQRGLLGIIQFLPQRPIAWLLGKLLFGWSELTADDAADLRRLRQNLYDSDAAVFRRLLCRLLCLREARSDIWRQNIKEVPVLVYGKSEWAIRCNRRWLRRLTVQNRIRLVTISGGHAISVTSNQDFVDTLILSIKNVLV